MHIDIYIQCVYIYVYMYVSKCVYITDIYRYMYIEISIHIQLCVYIYICVCVSEVGNGRMVHVQLGKTVVFPTSWAARMLAGAKILHSVLMEILSREQIHSFPGRCGSDEHRETPKKKTCRIWDYNSGLLSYPREELPSASHQF